MGKLKDTCIGARLSNVLAVFAVGLTAAYTLDLCCLYMMKFVMYK